MFGMFDYTKRHGTPILCLSTMVSSAESPTLAHRNHLSPHRREQVRLNKQAWWDRLTEMEKADLNERRREKYHQDKAAKALIDFAAAGTQDSGSQQRDELQRRVSRGTVGSRKSAVPADGSKTRIPRRCVAAQPAVARSLRNYSQGLVVAPSRVQGGGRGLFFRCGHCSRHPTRRFFSSTSAGRKQEYEAYANDPSLALTARRLIMCSHSEQKRRLVFKHGETIGYYFGKLVGEASSGPYVVAMEHTGAALNARHWGGLMRWANGRSIRAECNAAFAGTLKRFGSRYCLAIHATNDIHEHEEVMLYYGDQFDHTRDCLDWPDAIVPLERWVSRPPLVCVSLPLLIPNHKQPPEIIEGVVRRGLVILRTKEDRHVRARPARKLVAGTRALTKHPVDVLLRQ
jgi:hypothetical protein